MYSANSVPVYQTEAIKSLKNPQSPHHCSTLQDKTSAPEMISSKCL